jgi:hypothetical protein
LTGVVFEIAKGAKQPIAGEEFWAEAESWAEQYDDKPVATTRSDLRGGYFLCNLPRGISLFVSKPGFTTVVVNRIDASQSPTLDIELKRE